MRFIGRGRGNGISAETGAGVPELLRILSRLMPHPGEGNPPPFLKGEGDEAVRPQHGEVLRRWLAVADPSFRFDDEDRSYRKNVPYYAHTGRSVRGSLENELLCRCVVESFASAYYGAIHDATGEPLLREICDRLARDEARHFSAFHALLEEARRGGRAGWISSLRTIYRRIRDLACADVHVARLRECTAVDAQQCRARDSRTPPGAPARVRRLRGSVMPSTCRI